MKIVIVGGGTAGWLAALMVNKVHPNHSVTVIESSKIGIIGAGEGSTGLLTNILRNDIFDFGCDLLDFMKETGATIKYGILHKDWKSVGEKYLAPLAGSPTSGSNLDYTFCINSENDPLNMHRIHSTGIFAEKMLSPFSLETISFQNIGHALHFDAHTVGKYFKKLFLKNENSEWIDDEVTQVILDGNGDISNLLLNSGKTINADFFIDASGFSRVLMNKLDNKWVSYKENLPVNSAMPFLLPYEENEIPEPWTTAWAQSSGWMWQIPTLERKGCGYVFCDEFITAEQAQDEIEKTLGKKIQPIRILKFETGRLEKLWSNNCLAIGLCGAFAEPLEATSIHSTIVQLLTFVFESLKENKEKTCNFGSRNLYNARMSRMYDDFKDFLNIHYMGGRTDSEFWKYIKTGVTQTENTKNILEMCKYRIPNNKDFNQYLGGTDWGLYSYIMYGTGNLSNSVLSAELDSVFESSALGLSYREHANKVLQEYQTDITKSSQGKMNYKNFINFLRK